MIQPRLRKEACLKSPSYASSKLRRSEWRATGVAKNLGKAAPTGVLCWEWLTTCKSCQNTYASSPLLLSVAIHSNTISSHMLNSFSVELYVGRRNDTVWKCVNVVFIFVVVGSDSSQVAQLTWYYQKQSHTNQQNWKSGSVIISQLLQLTSKFVIMYVLAVNRNTKTCKPERCTSLKLSPTGCQKTTH